MKKGIAIGLNYSNTSYALRGCENDAFQMEFRMKKSVPSYTVTQFDRITGSVGADDLFARLGELADEQRYSDTFFLYMSGHGTQVPQDDGTTKEGICLFKGGRIEVVYDSDLRKALSEIPGTVIAIFDTCFSGGMEKSVAKPGGLKKSLFFNPNTMTVYTPDQNDSRISTGPNRLYYIAACQKDEVSWDTSKGGLFTLAFCEGYDKVDPSQRRVAYLTKYALNKCKPDQHPNYRTVFGSGSKRMF